MTVLVGIYELKLIIALNYALELDLNPKSLLGDHNPPSRTTSTVDSVQYITFKAITAQFANDTTSQLMTLLFAFACFSEQHANITITKADEFFSDHHSFSINLFEFIFQQLGHIL